MDRSRNADFEHVYWITGSPCAGKSSVARMLARRHGLFLYSCDEHLFGSHLPGADPSEFPALARARETMDRFYEPPADLVLETSLAYLREAFPLVLEDIARLPRENPVLAEGVCLLPDLLRGITEARRIVCIVPTPDFYADRQLSRVSVISHLSRYPDVDSAREHMTDEHALMARHFIARSVFNGIRVLMTSSEISLMDNLLTVERQFGLA